MEFKDKIKRRRIELKLTMEEVAKLVKVSTPTIQRYESGNIKNLRRDKIKLLADALKVTPAYLMDWEESPLYDEPRLTIEEDFEGVEFDTIAAHHEGEEWSEEELETIKQFKEFVKSQRKGVIM